MSDSQNAILRLEHYQQLVEISKELVTNHDLSSLLTHIVQAACELSGSEGSSILLYNDTSKELYFQVATGLEEPLMRGMVIPLEGSIAGWVVKNNSSVNILDVHSDSRFFSKVEQASQVKTKSLAGLPLTSQGKVIGVLEVINKKGGHFSEYDIEVLEVLVMQAALAIENTRLFQQSDQIAELVHELRTPLSSISTAAYLLQQETVSPEQRFSLSKTIYSETQRLSDLASSFLDLARLESGRVSFKPSQFSLGELIYETAAFFDSRVQHLHLQIIIDVALNIPLMTADRDKIKQVFLNLISNAIKYNKSDGWIKIQARADESSYQIKVSDNGLGMQPEVLAHLFEKFYRSKSTEDQIPGTGLGLSICKSIIESHHGQIGVESIYGQGTTFTIYIPRHAPN
jgi:signal transduction histidine kinase